MSIYCLILSNRSVIMSECSVNFLPYYIKNVIMRCRPVYTLPCYVENKCYHVDILY